MATTLFVGGLTYNTTDDELKELFERHAPIVSSVVIRDRETGMSKGFGFIEVEELNTAKELISKLNNTQFNDRNLSVKQARSTKNQPKPSRNRDNQRRRY